MCALRNRRVGLLALCWGLLPAASRRGGWRSCVIPGVFLVPPRLRCFLCCALVVAKIAPYVQHTQSHAWERLARQPKDATFGTGIPWVRVRTSPGTQLGGLARTPAAVVVVSDVCVRWECLEMPHRQSRLAPTMLAYLRRAPCLLCVSAAHSPLCSATTHRRDDARSPLAAVVRIAEQRVQRAMPSRDLSRISQCAVIRLLPRDRVLRACLRNWFLGRRHLPCAACRCGRRGCPSDARARGHVPTHTTRPGPRRTESHPRPGTPPSPQYVVGHTRPVPAAANRGLAPWAAVCPHSSAAARPGVGLSASVVSTSLSCASCAVVQRCTVFEGICGWRRGTSLQVPGTRRRCWEPGGSGRGCDSPDSPCQAWGFDPGSRVVGRSRVAATPRL